MRQKLHVAVIRHRLKLILLFEFLNGMSLSNMGQARLSHGNPFPEFMPYARLLQRKYGDIKAEAKYHKIKKIINLIQF